MDPGWDHTENEDKHLLTQVIGLSTFKDTQMAITSPNTTDRVGGSIGTTGGGGGCGCGSQELVSLSAEYINHLSNFVISIVNHYLILTFYINYYIYFSYDKNHIYHIYDVINNFIIRSTSDSKINSINYLNDLIHNFSTYKNFNILKHTKTHSLLYNLNLYEINYFIMSFVHYSINEFKSNVFLYEETSFYYDIPQILSRGIRRCCCICCFQYNLKCRNFKFTKFPNEYDSSVDRHLQFYVRSMADNHGNNLCLCLVTKYLLFGNVRTLMCYMRDIVGDLYSSVSRRFDKYTHSTGYMFSVGKLIMLLIKVIYKVTLWMKLKYLCTCPPNCPCYGREGAGSCSSGCYVCSQPPVPCCSCPKENNNCSTDGAGGNTGCCCKCKNGQGTSCCNCGSSTDGKCCRCCCNCFCKNYDDPYYPYLISITLFVSSLMENIWTMDTESVRMAMEKISSLLSEYQSIHVYTNYVSREPLYKNIQNFIIFSDFGSLTQLCLKDLYMKLNIKSSTLINRSIKSYYRSVNSILTIVIPLPVFNIVMSKLSSVSFVLLNQKEMPVGYIRHFNHTTALIYRKSLCQQTCHNKCCTGTHKECKICPITKIKLSCLNISMNRIEIVLSNVMRDILLFHLKKGIDRFIDFITNLCVGFGEVYAIMLKNHPISSSGYSNLRSYGSRSDMGVKDPSTINWGYDTGYEHQVTTYKSFSYKYPNLQSNCNITLIIILGVLIK